MFYELTKGLNQNPDFYNVYHVYIVALEGVKVIHQYKNNGYNIVLDVCSGSVHVVDDLVYDVIALYEQNSIEEIIKQLPQYK